MCTATATIPDRPIRTLSQIEARMYVSDPLTYSQSGFPLPYDVLLGCYVYTSTATKKHASNQLNQRSGFVKFDRIAKDGGDDLYQPTSEHKALLITGILAPGQRSTSSDSQRRYLGNYGHKPRT
jgi:hypothetical protein